MGIKTDEMGLAYTASMAAPGHEVAVTPLIGKLRLHIQGYVGHEEFYIMPLEGCDVLLGRFHLIYVKERDETKSSNMSSLDVSRSAFLDEYADCFSEALPGQLPPERPEDHNIDLIPCSAAPNKPPYRVSAAQQKEIMTHVNEALNKITVKNKFPIPRIDDVLARLQGASFFSRIDLKSGYHQIRVNPADVPKTAFGTTFGLYEFLVMPFGLTNAPATFNCMMDRIFRPLRHCVGTFFDDMIVFSKSEVEHMEHLRAVLEMLRKESLVVNGKKSEFFMEEIHFLGHIVSKDRVRMDPAKIKAIQDWPKLVNLHEVRSFLGLCSYYRRFIRFFAEIAAPLHDLTRKGVVFQFRERQQQAFKLLKEKLTTEPSHLLGADFTVQTDHQSFRYFLTQAKLSEKHLSWANFLSMFHFQLVHVAGKKNVVANALSRRPHVAAMSIAYQQELDEMRDHYSTDEDFVEPYDALVRGEHPDSYSLKDGFLIIQDARQKMPRY
ncbi:hypothetical protein L7F22_022045 [Adiantum nelumboides]|nr:hypothetical protein [Adiantum nelumboides]